MPAFFLADKLLINRCVGITRESLSRFVTYKSPKTRPSAPDDLKTHAIQVTDILSLTAYKKNTSQKVASFDKNMQPLPLRIGCAGR